MYSDNVQTWIQPTHLHTNRFNRIMRHTQVCLSHSRDPQTGDVPAWALWLCAALPAALCFLAAFAR